MSKHMTLEDRFRIAEGINRGESFSSIAKAIGKAQSTVSREVRNHRIVWKKQSYGRSNNRCVNRKECNLHNVCGNSSCSRKCSVCGKCAGNCPAYQEEHCARLNSAPYVCNACPDLNKCPLEKFRYDPESAQKEYTTVLHESREGFNLTQEELSCIDESISPLLFNGQSVHHAVLTNKDTILVGERTVYRLLDRSLLAARNIDLPRKCMLKPRRGCRPKRKIDPKCQNGRTYADFTEYIAQHPDILVVQMDSVVGGKDSKKVLLTLCFKGNFMPVFLRERNTAASVIEWFNFLYDGLGSEDFRKLFPVILTDNGSEFSNPKAIENAPDGTPRTKVFYCDPMASYQKNRCGTLP